MKNGIKYITVFHVISEHPLIGGHPYFLLVEIIALLSPTLFHANQSSKRWRHVFFALFNSNRQVALRIDTLFIMAAICISIELYEIIGGASHFAQFYVYCACICWSRFYESSQAMPSCRSYFD